MPRQRRVDWLARGLWRSSPNETEHAHRFPALGSSWKVRRPSFLRGQGGGFGQHPACCEAWFGVLGTRAGRERESSGCRVGAARARARACIAARAQCASQRSARCVALHLRAALSRIGDDRLALCLRCLHTSTHHCLLSHLSPLSLLLGARASGPPGLHTAAQPLLCAGHRPVFRVAAGHATSRCAGRITDGARNIAQQQQQQKYKPSARGSSIYNTGWSPT